jgi:ribosomal protein L21E
MAITRIPNGTRVAIVQAPLHPDLPVGRHNGATGTVTGWGGEDIIVDIDGGVRGVWIHRSEVRPLG